MLFFQHAEAMAYKDGQLTLEAAYPNLIFFKIVRYKQQGT